MHSSRRSLTAALFALAPLVHAGAGGSKPELSLVVAEGDVVPHFGAVEFVHGLEVNSSGEWIAIVARKVNSITIESASLRSGELELLPGVPLPSPVGASAAGYLEGQLDDDGNHLRRLWIQPESGPQADAYYWNNEALVLAEGEKSKAPEFASPHAHDRFYIQDRGGADVVAMASTFYKLPAEYIGQGIVTFRIAPDGRLFDEHLHVIEGAIAEPFGLEIVRVVTNPNSIAVNAAREVMYVVQLDAQTQHDYAVYINDEPIAIEGRIHRPSGLEFLRLQSALVDINDKGDHAFTAILVNEHGIASSVLLRNYEVWVTEGETFPAIAPHPLYKIVGHPLLAENGDLFWIGRWDAELTKTGLFRNRELIVESFVDEADGQLIEYFGHYSTRLDVSDDGRWAIFDAKIEGDREAAILVRM